MKVPDLSAASFAALLKQRYAPHFADAGHLLLRTVRGEDLYQLADKRRAFLMRWFLESQALKVALRRTRGNATNAGETTSANVPDRHEPYDVIGLFLPRRADYAVLLAPALRELKRRGRRVAVLTEEAASLDPELFTGVDVFDIADWATLSTYLAARGGHARLANQRLQLEREFGLDYPQRHNVSLILRAQAWDQHTFAAALTSLQPRAVFGLHLTLFPGIASALRERRAAGARTSTILIQHGVFSGSWEEHDFCGADMVLTWGEYFSAELASFPGQQPSALVVGNPRLEALLSRRTTDNEPAPAGGPSDHDGPRRVLYLGTNGVEQTDTEAVRIVADAIANDEQLKLNYLPHPNEPLRKYEVLIEAGKIRREQVLRGASAYDEVFRAAVVVGTQTTMLPEALALGIPAIQVAPEKSGVDWHELGLASASDPVTLHGLVTALVSDLAARDRLIAAAKPLVSRMFGEPRGVTDRVVAAIEAALLRTG